MKLSLPFKILCLGALLQATGLMPAAKAAEPDPAPSQRRSGVSEMLDSLVNTTYFRDERFATSSQRAVSDGFPRQFVPQFTDSVYASRIAELDRKSQFKLVYNEHVKGYIRVYAVDKRKQMAKMLGLTKVYFPLFEEKLREYNIPNEMKYLAIVESALNPTAVSRAGARGLWQFMGGTGRMYGLQTSSFIEDRYDPYKSTVAACEHLQDLYRIFGDWFLVLAAYNSGAGNVKKAIRLAGGARDYWEIWPYLPQETRGYVPAFIAVTYVMNYYREHNIRPLDPGYLYADIGTVPVRNALTFEQLSQTIGVPLEDLKFMNPQFTAGLIPTPTSPPHSLRLPKKYVPLFIQKEQDIYAYQTARAQERQKLYEMAREINREDEAPATERKAAATRGRKIHVVRRGESLAVVARRYRCSVSELVDWNNLRSSSVRPGQRIVVFSTAKDRASVAPRSKGRGSHAAVSRKGSSKSRLHKGRSNSKSHAKITSKKDRSPSKAAKSGKGVKKKKAVSVRKGKSRR